MFLPTVVGRKQIHLKRVHFYVKYLAHLASNNEMPTLRKLCLDLHPKYCYKTSKIFHNQVNGYGLQVDYGTVFCQLMSMIQK